MFGINRPIQVIDILALMGDKVDNIVGCPGVGEKTASKLILEFDSVENLIANTDKLKGALKTKVESNVDNILFSKKLATICTEVPIEFERRLTAATLSTKQPSATSSANWSSARCCRACSATKAGDKACAEAQARFRRTFALRRRHN